MLGIMGVLPASAPLLSLAPLVGSLVRRRFTGILKLTLDARRHAVYFQDGEIVDADAGSAEDSLGRVAVDAGLVDIESVGESLRRMAHDPVRSQKEILVQMGALGGDSLERALRMTLTRRAVRIFALAGATHRIDEIEHGRLEGGPVEPRWVVHRGIRTYYDEQRLDLELDSLVGKAVRLDGDPATIPAHFGFAHEEVTVVRYLAKRHYWELPDLVDYCQTVPRVVVLAVVHALHAFAALDVKPRGAVHRYQRAVREPTVQVPAVGSTPTPAVPAARGPIGTRPPSGAPPRTTVAVQPARPAERPDPVQAEAAKAMSASEHFRKGQVALHRDDFAAATKEFLAAVALDASWPDYHAFLAWSRWCDAKSKDVVFPEVQSGLVKAIKLSDHRCVPAFYFRGLMFEARSEHDKAYRCFQIVRSLDDSHIDAARRMHLIERRKQLSPKGLIERLRKK